jgi:large subunit ribosomal protein L5e
MGFVKVVKTKAYFKRLQTRYRRRREGKTDYEQRRALVRQEKNKYNTPKYRFVVRFSLTNITVQVVYATIAGDRTFVSAYSKELPRYGIKAGLTNYAAAYATGLLAARRALKKLGLDKTFVGQEEATGEEYHIEEEEEAEERRPFKCILDVGLKRTTVGSRIWGALKGGADGGLHIPHSIKRFPGYEPPEERGAEANYDDDAHKDRILGGHVSEYMESLKEEDQTQFESQFANYIKNKVTADSLEDMYKKAHAGIRAKPDAPKKKDYSAVKNKIQGNKVITPGGKTYTRRVKKTNKQRKDTVRQKIQAALKKVQDA